MKPWVVLTAFFLSLSALAGEGSPTFRNAFRAYVNLRRLEEKSRIAEQRGDLEEGARLQLSHSLSAELTSARIDFQAFLRPNEPGLSPWEKAVLKNAGAPAFKGVDKTALDFLSLTYAKTASTWTPEEWQCATDWFGKDVADSFLKITFGLEKTTASQNLIGAGKTILWITGPAGLTIHKDEAIRAKAKQSAVTTLLQHAGYTVQEVELHPFTRLDDQAEDLQMALETHLKQAPAILVSGGHASAVLLHTFDLSPRLLADPAIRGWVNMNGKLFGDSSIGRSPSSIAKADRQLVEARRELLPLREERLERQTPLSPKFPVVNLITVAGKFRPGTSLRDSLVPEGKSLYLENADAVDALAGALPYVESHAPAGQRDLMSDDSL